MKHRILIIFSVILLASNVIVSPSSAGQTKKQLPATEAAPILPDPRLTPGAILTTDRSVVCRQGYSKTARRAGVDLKQTVYARYRLSKKGGHYEMDHLVPFSIGGADVVENLWPQSHDTQPWNADVKDRLEWKLLSLVCRGELPMAQAQREIATNWIEAYKKYCQTERDCPNFGRSD